MPTIHLPTPTMPISPYAWRSNTRRDNPFQRRGDLPAGRVALSFDAIAIDDPQGFDMPRDNFDLHRLFRVSLVEIAAQRLADLLTSGKTRVHACARKIMDNQEKQTRP